MEQKEFLQKAFEQAQITLTAEQNDAFLRYADILCEWNRKFNLTAITDFEEIVLKHFVDCAAPLFAEKTSLSGKLIDVGSGAGFPGIPLKILCPDLQIVLLDSLQKRVNYLKFAVNELKLEGITAVHARAEDLARNDDFREKFDIATARAVAPLNILSEFCAPFIRPGGCFLAYKGEAAAEELPLAKKAFSLLGLGRAETVSFVLPGTEWNRCLIWTKKLKPTPAYYPRKAGTVSKKPL